MNDTTRWIMIALLLLLIGAAVFVLLRSPGKDGPEDADRADGDRDVPSTGARPAVAPRPERGVYDQAADEPVDRAGGQAAGGATAVTPQDDTRDDTTGGAASYDTTGDTATAYDDTTGDTAAAYDTSPDETTVHRGAATAYPATAAASEDRSTGSWGGADADTRPQDDRQVSDAGDEPLTADEVVASSGDRAGDEHPAGSTTYRAEDGDAVALDGAEAQQDAGSTPGAATTPMADRPMFMESIYGPGSAEPLADGAGPAGWTIKANTGSMLFHTPDSPSYDSVRAEVWFLDEEAARNAGFAHWDRRRR